MIAVAVCAFASLRVRSMWATNACLTTALLVVWLAHRDLLLWSYLMIGVGATGAELAASFRRRHGLTRKAER